MSDETEGVLVDELLNDDGPHPFPPARYAPTSCVEGMLPERTESDDD